MLELQSFCYDNCKDFAEDYKTVLDGERLFPMVKSYLLKDSCYLDDNWIKWRVYYQDDVPLAILATRVEPQYEGFTHVSVFEVNKTLRGKGLGTQILEQFLKDNPKSTLYAEKKNWNFYKHLGFDNFISKDKNFFVRGSL